MRRAIRFLRGGRTVELTDLAPAVTILDYLRLIEGATGTKEACGDGTCGACTVALGHPTSMGVNYRPANACTTLLAEADGCDLIAADDLAEDDGTLHPVQAALVAAHASQCGFCMPGMAMSLFCLFHATDGPVDRDTATEWIVGNVCRCGAYRPILDAALAASAGPRDDRQVRSMAKTTAALRGMQDGIDLYSGDEHRFAAAPTSLGRLAILAAAHPDATVVNGAALPAADKLILLRSITELVTVEATADAITFGAGVTLLDAEPAFAEIDPDLAALSRRIGGRQRRGALTIAGAIAGTEATITLPPALIALGATVRLNREGAARDIPVDSVFAGDGSLTVVPGELIVALSIPRLSPRDVFRAYAVAKRADSDPPAVAGAFRFTLDGDGLITAARIAYAGLAPRPIRAQTAEAALTGGRPRDRAAWTNAFAALKAEFTPAADHRGSTRYRTDTAQALLGKALIEIGGTSDRRTRLHALREVLVDVAG